MPARWADLVKRRVVEVATVTHRSPLPAPSVPPHLVNPQSLLPLQDALLTMPWLTQLCCGCDRCAKVASRVCAVTTSPPQAYVAPQYSPPSPEGLQRLEVPLSCPIRQATPLVPARFSQCTHLGCFDCFAVLHQWLHRLVGFDWDDFCEGRLSGVVWRCPCCNCEVPVLMDRPTIMIDGWLVTALSAAATDGRSPRDAWVLVQDGSGGVSLAAGTYQRPKVRPSMVVTIGD